MDDDRAPLQPPDGDAARRRTLHRLAWLTAALLLATIGLSAYMRLVQAGLGCADWPACYAESFRLAATPAASAAESAARLAHRIVATAALALMLAMTMLAWTTRPVTPAWRRWTTALLALALGLSALGVITPGARLPAVGMGNLLGGFAALALCVRLLALTSASPPRPDRRLQTVAGIAAALLVVQLALGALLSTSYAALACTDFADCHRAAAAGGWDWRTLNPWREPGFDFATPHVRADGALVQWLHRVGALIVAAALAIVGLLAMRRGQARLGLVLIVLTAAQVGLGLAAVAGGLPIVLVLLHNLGAALLLAALVALMSRAARD